MEWTPDEDMIEAAMREQASLAPASHDAPEPTGGGLWTPSELKDYIRNIANGYKSLLGDMRACQGEFTDKEWSAWTNLYNSFAKFVKDLIYWDLLWGGTADTAERYARQLEKWRKRYRERCGREPSAPSIDPDPKSPKGSNTVTTLATIAVVGMGIYLGIKVVDLVKE